MEKKDAAISTLHRNCGARSSMQMMKLTGKSRECNPFDSIRDWIGLQGVRFFNWSWLRIAVQGLKNSVLANS